MSQKVKVLLSFLTFLLFVGWASSSLNRAFGIPVPASVISMTALAIIGTVFSKADPTVARNGIQQELWANYIIKRFRKDNKFLQFAFNDSQYVLSGAVVHIPQPGSKPNIVKNRSSYPAAAVQRVDTVLDYPLDVYTSDPTHITDADKVELSYSKMDDVLGDHIAGISELAADDLLIKWATANGGVINTSGASTAAYIPGQTGTRKVAIHQDLRKGQLLFNLQNVSAEDRYALLEANMADQLFDSLSNTQYRDFSQYANAETGVIGKLYSFNIMTRSSVAMAAATTNAINPLGSAVAATDNAVSLLWHKNSVAHAMGQVKMFQRENDPLYYGDIYSALLRCGGRVRRGDGAGIAALVAAA